MFISLLYLQFSYSVKLMSKELKINQIYLHLRHCLQSMKQKTGRSTMSIQSSLTSLMCHCSHTLHCTISISITISRAPVIIVDGANKSLDADTSQRPCPVPHRVSQAGDNRSLPDTDAPPRTLPRSPADIDRMTRVSGVRRGRTVD